MKGYFRKRGKTWSYTVDIGKDPISGKRRQKSKGGFRTKKDAEKDCADFISKFDKGSIIIRKDITIKEFIEFFLSRAELKLKNSTYTNYNYAVNNRIIPRLGNIKLQEFTKYHGQEFVNELSKEELSSLYIRFVISLLKNMFQVAIEDERIIKNPMDSVIMPRSTRRSYNVWSAEELKRFLSVAQFDDSTYYLTFLIAAHTGMRRGEILGLRWKDVDLEGKRISVNQSLTYVKGRFQFSDLKNSYSFRMIAIDDFLVKQLKKHRTKQNEHRLAKPAEYNFDLVCSRADGRPLLLSTLRAHFQKHIDKANVPKIRFHDLRHTHATILLKMRENPKIVSERLGHSTIVRTLDTYSHVIPDMQEDTASKFSDLMKNQKSV
ncbi:site-specific integrase [Priestia sp. SB1]|uniref:site-specific integrase n=1 Tax=Priestia TaxID=2800373 RepID=UPI000BF56E1E|nr:site-specific integrase [Priestia megaterium]PFI93372.1 site-specific integrase [Priestia megaterium]PGR11811.1 site-specific integrase [Priestia megaterium]